MATASAPYFLNSKVADVAFFLACALTGKPEKDVANVVRDHSLSELVEGREFYLPDGGYSRIVVSEATGRAFLTDNSRAEVKSAWNRCSELVADLEKAVLEARQEIDPDYQPYA